jgi:hypothetical protein
MTLVTAAGFVFAAAICAVVAFQVGLALGAPWGEYAMGGRFRTFPPRLRAAAVVQALVLALLAWIVLSAAGIVAPTLTDGRPWLAWLPVAVSVVSLVLNLITPSARERRIWAPVGAVMLISSVLVALAG